MHSETTSQQHATALRSTLVPRGGLQAETAILPPVSAQPATAIGGIPLPSVFLSVDFPNGGETLKARDTVTVGWSTSVQDGTPVTSHEVRLFADGNLVTEVTGLPGITQSYQLTLPDINTTRAVVSVSAINGIRVLAGDRSDNVFTIQGSSTGPVITAIDPPAIRAGATTRVTVNGTNLPLATSGYTVVDNAGQGVVGVGLFLVPGSQTNQVALDITIPAFVAAGQYRLRAQKMAGFDTAPLDVVAGISKVELSASPSAQSISPGQSASYTINLNRTNFAGAVTLAVSGLPSGAISSFSPSPAAGTSSLLTITTPANTAPGTRTLTISGAALGATITATTASLTVSSGVVLGVQVTKPDMPQTLDVEATLPIAWLVTGTVTNQRLQFVANSGEVKPIVAGLDGTARSFNWWIPSDFVAVGQQLSGRIRVIARNPTTGSETMDDSDVLVTVRGMQKGLQFFPTSGLEGTDVEISGIDISGAIDVLFGSISAAEFTVKSSNSIIAEVPEGAPSGRPITMIFPNSRMVTSTGNFTVLSSDNKAQIESFKPTAGPVGSKVSIKGKNFINVTRVKFSVKPNGRGGVEASSIITENSELIIAFVPQVQQGSEIGRIKVKTRNNGAAISKMDFRGTEFGAPEVNSFSPSSGYKDQSITIMGRNFVEVSSVKFGNVTAGFRVIDDEKTRIVASVPILRKPEEGPLRVPISVTNPVDTFTTEDLLFMVTSLPLPKINKDKPFDPPQAAVGDWVTIRGENFIQISDAPSTVEFFDGVAPRLPAPLIQGNPPDNTLFRAFVPTDAKTGPVKVTTPGGSDTSTVNFIVEGAPAATPLVNGFDPAAVAVGAEQFVLRLLGTNFVPGAKVLIRREGSTAEPSPVLTTSINDRMVDATLPDSLIQQRGKLEISVRTPDDRVSNVVLVPVSAPMIESIAPTAIRAGKTVTLTIQASNIYQSRDVPGSRRTDVLVDNFLYRDHSIQITSPGRGTLTVQVPGTRLPAGGHVVQLSNPTDTEGPASGNSMMVQANPSPNANAPIISLLEPRELFASKMTAVVATGSNLSTLASDYSVLLKRTAEPPPVAKFKIVSATGSPSQVTLQIQVPGEAMTEDHLLKVKTMTGEDTEPFLVLLPPVAGFVFAPTTGPSGQLVRITGPSARDATDVLFNGVSTPEFGPDPADPSGSIFAEVPEGIAGAIITLVTPMGPVASQGVFTVIDSARKPAIVSFSPPCQNVEKTLTVMGRGFVTDQTFVKFPKKPNGKTDVKATVLSNTMLTVPVPSNAVTGFIKVRVGDVVSRASDKELVVGKPMNVMFVLPSGQDSVAAGDRLMLTGMNFVPGKLATNAPATVVTFSNGVQVPEAQATVASTTSITVTVPVGAITGPITVTTPCGMATSPTITVKERSGPKPEITSFAPLEGIEGTQVEIVGKNFAGTTAVMFGGTRAPFIVNSPESITTYVPFKGSTDVSISVMTANSSTPGSSTRPFRVKDEGSSFGVTGFHPSKGKAGDIIMIFGGELNTVDTVIFDTNLSVGVIADSPSDPNFPSNVAIKAKIPAGAKNGFIRVRDKDLQRESQSAGTLIVDTTDGTPSIDGFTPRTGPLQVEQGKFVTVISGMNFRTSDGQNNVKKVTFSGSDVGVDFDVVTDPITQMPVVRVKKVSTFKNPTAYITIESSRGSTNVTSARAFIAIPLGTVFPPKGKDTKEKEKEFKEKESEGKDFRKDFKDNREGKDLFEFPSTGVIQPMERLARLEGAVNQLMHFISPELRPDLNAGALQGEPERSSDDRVALSQLLQKQASDTKQAKDTKDMEKFREAQA